MHWKLTSKFFLFPNTVTDMINWQSKPFACVIRFSFTKRRDKLLIILRSTVFILVGHIIHCMRFD